MNKRLVAFYVTILIIVLIFYLYLSLNQTPVLTSDEIHCLSMQHETISDFCSKFMESR